MKGVIPWQTDPDWPHGLRELEIDPQRTALLMVDIQNYSSKNQQIAPNCTLLRDFFHAHGLEVVYLRVGHLLPDRGDMHPKRALSWLRLRDRELPAVLKGTREHDIIDVLAPLPGELVIDKNSTSAFNSSALERYLHALEVQNLVLCGGATSHCVDNTARGAADWGYNVVLVEDACIDPSPQNHAITMRSFGRAFGAVKSTSQVIKELEALLAQELEPSSVGA